MKKKCKCGYEFECTEAEAKWMNECKKCYAIRMEQEKPKQEPVDRINSIGMLCLETETLQKTCIEITEKNLAHPIESDGDKAMVNTLFIYLSKRM